MNEYFEMDIVQLMNITVTSASKKAQHLSDVPSAIFVITQEDIRRSGVRSIPEALAMAPGLQVFQINGYRWSVSSRGFPGYNSTKLLILIDGRSLYSPGYSGTYWDSQSTLLEDVDRIEVIRGPGATVWGANAVNGIINIITKEAKETQGGLIRLGIGNEGRLTSAARYGLQLGEDTYGRFSLSYDSSPANTLLNQDPRSGSYDAQDSWQPMQAGFRLDGQPNGQTQWTLQGDLLVNNEDTLLFPYWIDQAPYLSSLDDSVTITRTNLLGRFSRDYGAGRALNLQSYVDISRYDMVQSRFEQNFSTLDLDLQYFTPLGDRHNLILGAGFRQTEIDFTSDTILIFPDRRDQLYSAFVQDEISLVSERLWLTLGSKYEHNDYTGSEWQPSAKLLWKPRSRHTFWASLARAVRTPTILEQQGETVVSDVPPPWGAGTVSFVGQSDFESEILLAYEAGYRWQASPVLSLDLALFLNDYDKLFTFVTTPAADGYDLLFDNGLEGLSYGVEASLDWKAAHWISFILSYSYLAFDIDRSDPAGSTDLVDYFEELNPRHQASLRSSISLARDWQLNLWLRYVGELTGRDSRNILAHDKIAIDGYTVFNANIIWTPTPNLELMLSGRNLLNASQLEFANEYLVPPTEIKRSMYGKLTWRF